MNRHHCEPPSTETERWTCDCGRTWVAHGPGGWRLVPTFVPMTPRVHGKD